MKEIKGKYTTAKVFTDNVETLALEQVQELVNHKLTEKTKVRLMPDIHYGKGSTIGTTIKLPENFRDWEISPNIVGVDLGCGIMMYKLSDKEIDLVELDEKINRIIPAGRSVHNKSKDSQYSTEATSDLTFNLSEKEIDRVDKSLGTLGGGNHFLELGKDEDENYWLSVHSGSRGLGVLVAKHHQNIAINKLEKGTVDIKKVIEKMKAENRYSEIENEIKFIKDNIQPIDNKAKELATLKGQKLADYINDMTIAQEYASKSREIMLNLIVESMGLTVVDKFDSVHNFIEHDDLTNGTIRKGATSAKAGERLVIPLNMRDGSIIAKGKGNEDWNNSAPHGAGRLMSRSKARENIKLEDFKETMNGIYSSSITSSTVDEAPEAYKPAKEILAHIKPTVDVIHLVKPVYNFKAAD